MNPDEVRAALETRLAKLTDRVARIDADLGDPGSKDWEERASENQNEEVLERLSDAERGEIAEIRAALGRIAAGSYGICAGCGEAIPPRRLEALPYTGHCISCSS